MLTENGKTTAFEIRLESKAENLRKTINPIISKSIYLKLDIFCLLFVKKLILLICIDPVVVLLERDSSTDHKDYLKNQRNNYENSAKKSWRELRNSYLSLIRQEKISSDHFTTMSLLIRNSKSL